MGEFGPNDKPHELGRIQEAPQELRNALAAYRQSGAVQIKMVGYADSPDRRHTMIGFPAGA